MDTCHFRPQNDPETQVDPTTLNEVRDFLLEHEADKKRLGILKLCEIWKYDFIIVFLAYEHSFFFGKGLLNFGLFSDNYSICLNITRSPHETLILICQRGRCSSNVYIRVFGWNPNFFHHALIEAKYAHCWGWAICKDVCWDGIVVGVSNEESENMYPPWLLDATLVFL